MQVVNEKESKEIFERATEWLKNKPQFGSVPSIAVLVVAEYMANLQDRTLYIK